MNEVKKLKEMKKLLALRDELMSLFVQREEAITGVLAGLLTKRPAILIGAPGTAKTRLITALAKRINGTVFSIHLDPETDIDQIMGVIDIEAYRRGEYRRISKGYLPDADVVLIHEVFRGSRAVRDLLLDILERGYYKENTELIKIKAVAFYFDTNFISDDVEDQAFLDRCTVRVFVNYVSGDAWKELIEKAILLEKEEEKEVKPVITLEEVKALQRMCRERFYAIPQETKLLNKYFLALAELRNNGIEVSDRMKVRILHVASAISMIYLENEVSLDSVADALRLCVPLNEEQRSVVEQVIMKCQLSTVWENVQALQALRDELKNAISHVQENPSDLTRYEALSKVYKRTLLELKRLPKNPRLIPYVRELMEPLYKAKELIDKASEIFNV